MTFAEYLQNKAKPPQEWRCGIEIELFGFNVETQKRIDQAQVNIILRALAATEGNLVFENSRLIETRMPNGGKFTVEPGGQIEFSSVPRLTLSELESDLKNNLLNLKAIGEKLKIVFLALGFDPVCRLEEQNWFLKSRYEIMKPYLGARGGGAWDMMTRTCSVQINLDYENEIDFCRKFVLGNRLAPIATAIFANSPFANNSVSNYQSRRAAAWLETDGDRCGVAPLALRDEFSYADFVDYALRVPMLFVRRDQTYFSDFTGKSFREFLISNKFNPTLSDWIDHLTTIFTETRARNYLEFRSADAGNLEHALAVAAFWKGLLYDNESLEAALKIAPKLDAEQFVVLQKCVAENGLQAVYGNINVLDLAKKIVVLAVAGLKRYAPSEAKFLNNLERRIINEEKTAADLLLENCQNSIDNIFELTKI